jgi:hypothetical protein
VLLVATGMLTTAALLAGAWLAGALLGVGWAVLAAATAHDCRTAARCWAAAVERLQPARGAGA